MHESVRTHHAINACRHKHQSNYLVAKKMCIIFFFSCRLSPKQKFDYHVKKAFEKACVKRWIRKHAMPLNKRGKCKKNLSRSLTYFSCRF